MRTAGDRTADVDRDDERSKLPSRFSLLTASRYFAALSVLLYHLPAANQWLAEHQHTLILRLVENGFVAVTYFFVLSGFVLSHGYMSGFSTLTLAKIGAFYRARLVRILPVWLFLSLPFLMRLPDAKWLAYVSFTQAWSSSPEVAFAFLAVTWTLSVEFFFYLLFPILARMTHCLSGWTAAALFLALGFLIPLAGALYFDVSGLALLPTEDPLSAHRWLYRNPVGRLGDFLAGIGLYLAFRQAVGQGWLATKFAKNVKIISASALIACICFIVGLGLLPLSVWTYDAQFLPAFTLLIGLLAWCETQFNWRAGAILVLLGEASYALYVVHFTYGRVLLSPLQEQAGTDKMSFSLWAMAFLTVVSIGCYVAIERPVQRLLRRAPSEATTSMPRRSAQSESR